MPIVVGIAAALWILFILATIGAVLVCVLVTALTADVLDGFRRRPAAASDPSPLEVVDQHSTTDDLDALEDWLPSEFPYWSSDTAWWWSAGGSAPEIVIDGRHKPTSTAVAAREATGMAARNQIWTIHPDHSAHWQDQAGDCPWCRNDPT
jgi:hypothetical protein